MHSLLKSWEKFLQVSQVSKLMWSYTHSSETGGFIDMKIEQKSDLIETVIGKEMKK